MLVYIKDVTIKEKTRISSLKEMFNMSIFGNKLKVFNHYLKELAEDWDIIIIGKNIKYHNLIHSKILTYYSLISPVIKMTTQFKIY